MKTGIGQRQVQLQKLSPQQIQLMKLLQVPTVLLDQRIKEELEINPALEEGEYDYNEDDSSPSEDFADGQDAESEREQDDLPYEQEDYVEDYMGEDDSYKLWNENGYSEEDERQAPVVGESSFHEYLVQQLGLLEFKDAREEEIARQLLGSIDEDGYLRRDPISVCDDLLFSRNMLVEEEEVLAVLQKIQHLDPPGTGARDLQECLRLQLEFQLEQAAAGMDDDELHALEIAHKLISKYFEPFSKKHYEKLQRALGISEDSLKDAIGIILKLNPKPASAYTGNVRSQSAQYVIPDFVVRNIEGTLELSLNARNAPELRISDEFRNMFHAYNERRRQQKLNKQDREAMVFIRQKIESARWFIDAIRQRHDTMFRTMYAILQYQQDYFNTGDQKRIRPMILQDVADMTGLDVSTVSRVANSKFVQTEYGTRRLKEFFSEALQNVEGEEVSTLEVKKILTDLIGGEDKRHPLSDDRLTQLLQEKGYHIARRTVAKYRDQLSVPKASLRKAL